MYAGVDNYSQIGEVLSITLLRNAQLNILLLTNTKLQLVHLAEAHNVKHPEKIQHLSEPSQQNDLVAYAELSWLAELCGY